jgi:septum formation protein
VRLLGLCDVRIHPSNVDETIPDDLSPEEKVGQLAVRKAVALASRYQDQSALILGADTIVVLDNLTLGKPQDPDDAIQMLKLLSGRTHTVYTGVALYDTLSSLTIHFVEHTDVTFRVLLESEIVQYVASGSPMDKAGSYGIQEDFGAVFVSRIDGDYYNVVGLPLCALYQHLRSFAPGVFRS